MLNIVAKQLAEPLNHVRPGDIIVAGSDAVVGRGGHLYYLVLHSSRVVNLETRDLLTLGELKAAYHPSQIRIARAATLTVEV